MVGGCIQRASARMRERESARVSGQAGEIYTEKERAGERPSKRERERDRAHI